MAIPPMVWKRAEEAVRLFCARRAPADRHHQYQLEYRLRGNAVTYDDIDPAPELAPLLAEIERDPTGILWG